VNRNHLFSWSLLIKYIKIKNYFIECKDMQIIIVNWYLFSKLLYESAIVIFPYTNLLITHQHDSLSIQDFEIFTIILSSCAEMFYKKCITYTYYNINVKICKEVICCTFIIHIIIMHKFYFIYTSKMCREIKFRIRWAFLSAS